MYVVRTNRYALTIDLILQGIYVTHPFIDSINAMYMRVLGMPSIYVTLCLCVFVCLSVSVSM